MYFVYFLTIPITTLHFLKFFQKKTPLFVKNPLFFPFLLFLFSQTISTFVSVDRHTSIFGYPSRLNGGLLSLFAYFILSQILFVNLTEKFKRQLIATSLLSGFFVSVYGIAQHLGIDKHLWVQDVQNRVFSTLGQPNWLAAYLCILLPFLVDKFLNSKNKLHFTVYGLLITDYFLCLLYTKSQSGILAAIVTLSLFLFVYFLKTKKILLPFTVYGLLIILLLTINNPIRDRIFPEKSFSTTKYLPPTILITPSENIRQIVWQGAIDLWKKFPLFGTGPETFAYTYYWTRPVSHNLTSEWDFLYNKAHNEYLNYLATTGTFGFVTYLILIFYSLYLIHNTYYLIPFISILITNFTGFSVVTSSLYFFILPVLAFNPSPKKSPASPTNPLPLLIIISLSLFITQKLLYFYLADISYSQASSYNANNQLILAQQAINRSLDYRPREPNYLMESGIISAKLTATTKDPRYLQISLLHSSQALDLSPASLNLWKESAQLYYYLSVLDSKYLNQIPISLVKAASLAPTDAKIPYLLGQFYDTVKDYPSATKYYQQAINLKPNYDHAHFALALILFNQKQYPEAKTYFESVLQTAPNNSEAKDYLHKIDAILNLKS